MNHYYSKQQDKIASEEKTFTFKFKEILFKFTTDHGVFCKDYIDFGSQVLIKAYQPNTIDAPILDMGCGYGPIGVILSKVYQKNVHMFDINERAVTLANKNAKQNGANAIAVQSDLYDNVKFSQYATCVTNPPIRAGKKVVFAIYDGAFDHLVEGGDLYVVIQKKQGALSSKVYLTEKFGNCEIISKDRGYFILYCVKKEKYN